MSWQRNLGLLTLAVAATLAVRPTSWQVQAQESLAGTTGVGAPEASHPPKWVLPVSWFTSVEDEKGVTILWRDEVNFLPVLEEDSSRLAYVHLKKLENGKYFVLTTLESSHGTCTRPLDRALGERIEAVSQRLSPRMREVNDDDFQQSDYHIHFETIYKASASPLQADAGTLRSDLYDLTTALSVYCHGLSSRDEKRIDQFTRKLESDGQNVP